MRMDEHEFPEAVIYAETLGPCLYASGGTWMVVR